MCEGCWEEYGSPHIVTPAVLQATDLVARVYDGANGGVGGYGHIVLDDWNLDDGSVKFCLLECDNNEAQFPPDEVAVQRECLQAMLALTEAERASVLALDSGFFDVECARQ